MVDRCDSLMLLCDLPDFKNDPNIPPNRRNADIIIMHNKHKHLEVSNSSQF